jgi:hypothetical protein
MAGFEIISAGVHARAGIPFERGTAVSYETEHHTRLVVTAASTIYRPTFATVTNNRNVGSGSRRTPAATVIGSPTIGSQLASNDHRP